jgi:hypothetical protein
MPRIVMVANDEMPQCGFFALQLQTVDGTDSPMDVLEAVARDRANCRKTDGVDFDSAGWYLEPSQFGMLADIGTIFADDFDGMEWTYYVRKPTAEDGLGWRTIYDGKD